MIDTVTLASVVVSVSAVVVAILAVTVQWMYQKKQYQFSALIEVHKMVMDKDARDARRKTFETYRKYRSAHDIELFRGEASSYVNVVEADLDIIGSMVNQGFIPRDAFFSIYVGLVTRTWRALKDDIEDKRRKRPDSHFMGHFEQLNALAERHWQRRFPDEPIPAPY